MRSYLTVLAAVLAATPASALEPPREQSPLSEAILSGIGAGNSDAALAEAVAAASAYPLGTIQNPVRVGGPVGERAYMARLRCADGSQPTIGDKSDGGVGAFGSVVNLYPLDCGAAAPGRFDLILDIYHGGHVEDRAPAGFEIAPR